jgi:hypothetical protein
MRCDSCESSITTDRCTYDAVLTDRVGGHVRQPTRSPPAGKHFTSRRGAGSSVAMDRRQRARGFDPPLKSGAFVDQALVPT